MTKTRKRTQEEVMFDSNRLGQLFANLLGNADSHGAEDEPINVSAVTKDKIFKLSVSNGGEKIPESAMKYLFQPFYRNNVRPGKKGLGLGLFIASEIAKAHEGELNVKSDERQSEFIFTMPTKTST